MLSTNCNDKNYQKYSTKKKNKSLIVHLHSCICIYNKRLNFMPS